MYCLVVLMSPALSFEMKGTQCRKVTEFNQVRVYPDRVYADNAVSKFWFVRSFFSQHHSNVYANITSENVAHVRIKKRKTKSFKCNVNLNLFSTPRHFNTDTVFAVIVSLLSESVQSFNKICNRKVKTRFHRVKLCRL